MEDRDESVERLRPRLAWRNPRFDKELSPPPESFMPPEPPAVYGPRLAWSNPKPVRQRVPISVWIMLLFIALMVSLAVATVFSWVI